jgi:hypothetical protein
MGTWGTAIFSDDLACDIRDRYRQMLGDGLEGQQATQSLMAEYKDALDDEDAARVFWLALAAIQWSYGRLEQDVQQRAINIIDRGEDMQRWTGDSRLFDKRQAVLNKLRATLASPQPPPRRIPKPFRDSCDWEIGEIIAYQLRSGNMALLRVIGHYTDLGGTCPIFEILDWVGSNLPGQEALVGVGIRSGKNGKTQLKVMRVSQRELPRKRLTRTGIILKPTQEVKYPLSATLWRWLDKELEVLFGLE